MPPIPENRAQTRPLPLHEKMKPPVNLLRPRTWTKYRASLCHDCMAGCCTLPVRVDAEDLHHMGFLSAHQITGPLKRIASRLKRAQIISSYHNGNKTFLLHRKPNQDCVFLTEKRRCAIYDRRPAVCRRFPLNSARPGYCPRQRQV